MVKLKDKKTPLQKEFGSIVRKRRLKLQITQEELAEQAHLHFTYVSSLERGERNVSLVNINKLAKGLGCTMAELMPLENSL